MTRTTRTNRLCLALEGLEHRELCAVDFSLAGGILTIYGTAEADIYRVGNAQTGLKIEHSKTDTFHPSTTEAVIVPTNGVTVTKIVFDGKGGNDYFEATNLSINVDARGGDGNDVIFGGDGDDKLSGDAGDDFLLGSAGSDTLYGGSGNDFLLDALWGPLYGGNNKCFGGAGVDTIEGGLGGDLLDGGRGEGDIVKGNGGADVFVVDLVGNDAAYANLLLMVGPGGKVTPQQFAALQLSDLDRPQDYTSGEDRLVLPQ